MKYELEIKDGHAVTDEELKDFMALVLSDNQVAHIGLDDRIRGCHHLAFLRKGKVTVAVGAIKNNPAYRDELISKSGTELAPERYLGEVGYLHTSSDYRRRNCAELVLKGLLEKAGGKSLFSTVQGKNAASQGLLAKCGFGRSGSQWKSEQKDDTVCLYLYSPPPISD